MATSKAEAAKAEAKHWYVMRDLTRHNARRPAHVMLKELGIRYFTPMTWRANLRGGRRIRERVPYIPDLIFVYDCRAILDPIVEQVSTFQYRYLRGTYREPMTVRESDMEQFILAVGSSEEPVDVPPPGEDGWRPFGRLRGLLAQYTWQPSAPFAC